MLILICSAKRVIGISKSYSSAFWRELRKWECLNFRRFPWRDTNDPFFILIAEIMLQKTAAKPVVGVYQGVASACPTVYALADIDINQLKKMMAPLGLIRRAERLILLAQEIVRNYGGKVPKERTALLSLPGVGMYTADAVMCFAFGTPVIPIDTNTARIAERIFGIKSIMARPRRDKRFAESFSNLLPKKNCREHVFGLIDFASGICKAAKPKCNESFWENSCLWNNATRIRFNDS
jgi:A/G-specific adenine glycosylase